MRSSSRGLLTVLSLCVPGGCNYHNHWQSFDLWGAVEVVNSACMSRNKTDWQITSMPFKTTARRQEWMGGG